MRKGFLIQYMIKCANIFPYMRRPLVIHDFATAPFWISLYLRKILFSFLSVYSTLLYRVWAEWADDDLAPSLSLIGYYEFVNVALVKSVFSSGWAQRGRAALPTRPAGGRAAPSRGRAAPSRVKHTDHHPLDYWLIESALNSAVLALNYLLSPSPPSLAPFLSNYCIS